MRLPATARLALLAFLVLGPAPLKARADEPWIGRRVITKHGTVLKIGEAVVDDEKRSLNLAIAGRDRRSFRIYRVRQVDGPWVWLVAENEGVEGWARAKNVIPCEQAIDYITTRIRANPNSATYTWRGFLWVDKKEYDIALGDYNEAIRLDPQNETAFVNRGNVWQAKKEHDKALADYDEAIRLDPKYAMPYHNRGNTWQSKEEYDKALADYDEAIRLDPKYASAYDSRGSVWHGKKEYDKALADYDEAIRLNPENASTYYNRGNTWRRKKEHDKALADYDEAIRLNPKFVWAYNNRGLAWQAKKEYDKALADYDEAIRLNPEDAHVYSVRAATFLAIGHLVNLADVHGWLDASGWDGAYSSSTALIGHFCLRRSGHDDDARKLLDEAAAKLNVKDWPYPVVRYLRKEIDGPALLAAAADQDKMTEARTFLGLDLIFSGRPDEALPALRWVKDHGNPSYVEHAVAAAELERIEKAKAK